MHVADHALHHLDGARRAGHDAGAQGGQVEFLETGVVKLGDEHGGHAVQTSAFLGLHRLQHRERIEAVVWVHHGGAMREAGQIAQHHAEAVVQRHRNAQAVGRCELHAFANEEAVVEDVAVRERGALGEAGGAAGELDVDGVAGLERGALLGHPRVVFVALGHQGRKRHQAGGVQFRRVCRAVDPHHGVQAGQLFRLQLAGR